MVLSPPEGDSIENWAHKARDDTAEFGREYAAYFERCDARDDINRTMLDSAPRLVLVPGVGLFGFGRTTKDARIVADIGEI